MDLRRIVARRREDDAEPDRPVYLFVVTYGRSGSTLVQGLLNALPGTLIRGENNFFILPLFNAWTLLSTFQSEHANEARQGVRSAFYGLDEMNPGDFVETTRDLATRQLYGAVKRSTVDMLGFKEVLWHRIRPRQTEEFFGFFDAVFPGARYVLNRRDHEEVATSGFWRTREREEVIAALSRVEKIQDHLRETRPERTHDTRYDVLTSLEPSVVEGELIALAQFALGRCDRKILADMSNTLKEGHGPRPFGASRTEEDAAPSH